MPTWAIVPVKQFQAGKSRLRIAYTVEELIELNRNLYRGTLEKLLQARGIDHILVVSREPEALCWAEAQGACALLEEQPCSLNAAVEQGLAWVENSAPGKILVLPTDLPNMTVQDLDGLLEFNAEGRFICIVPDHLQIGTNALYVSDSRVIRPRFGRSSFQKHLTQALNDQVTLKIYLNQNIQSDLDTLQDMELLDHCPITTETLTLLRLERTSP